MLQKSVIFGLAISSILVATVSSQAAAPCPADPLQCTLPDCRCSSQAIPNNLVRDSIPQVIIFSVKKLLLKATKINNLSETDRLSYI